MTRIGAVRMTDSQFKAGPWTGVNLQYVSDDGTDDFELAEFRYAGFTMEDPQRLRFIRVKAK